LSRWPMELKCLTLENRQLFERFLGARRHELSVYGFPAIYGWKKLFEISWVLLRSSLCIFFEDAAGCFLYLPPLGEAIETGVVEECFRIMDARNAAARVSRIENVEELDLDAFKRLGYAPVFKSHDYVYERAALAGLRGDRFKSKRALANRFVRDNQFQCLPYSPAYKDQCLSLYREWMAGRGETNTETVYCGMLSDSLRCLETVLEDAAQLAVDGLVVISGGTVAAFTLGYRLNADTLCVFFEIADLSLKGLGQFIFRSFCRQNEEFRYVNAMDDSGLENLKNVKNSYKPVKLASAYIINHIHARD
jgi:uncharacterized protein